jgi:hypothetical protein
MNAPPISEATFRVEEACSAMVDPETPDPDRRMLGTAEGVAQFPCATENAAKKKKRGRNANNPPENDLIERLNFPQSPETNGELTAES